MRRNALLLGVVGLGLVLVVGCTGRKKDVATADTGSDYAYEPYQPAAAPAEPAGPMTGYETTAGQADYAGAGVRYHTVAKGDTLYSLARMYYNDQRRWKDILEANSDQISDPNKIRVGQRLIIP